MKRARWFIPLGGIILLYAVMVAAPFIAPYSHKEQFREHFYMPPANLHFFDRQGQFHWRPFIFDYERDDSGAVYVFKDRRLPIHFLVEGTPYRLFGLESRIRLFGLEDSSKQIFLLGSDRLGRDLFSRILYGARFSLSVGLVAILFAFLIGIAVGGLAGYAGDWTDRVIMRICDLFLSLPGLFLVLGLRAVFPLEMSGQKSFWMIVTIFTVIGGSTVTRIVRGQVLSLKTRPYVLAAEAAGATPWRIFTRHILPFTSNYLLVQGTVFIPLFIMGEITLSFLGVGVQEPDVSWGNLLAAANSVQVVTDYPWLASPAVFILLTTFLFYSAGDALRVLETRQARWW